MLVLSRQHNEAIYIGHAIKVVVVDFPLVPVMPI